MPPEPPLRTYPTGQAEPVTLVRPDGVAVTVLAGASTGPGAVDLAPASVGPADFDERYAFRRVLGEGGMGEVRLCHDARIGRDVAIKVIRDGHGSQSDLRMRFLREARIQGQLEHPMVVPVYDIGIDAAGQTFFTMKRLHGLTLEQILDDLRHGDAATGAQHGLRRLLSALSSVCLAMAFAHARGVIHRDLKPANIMLGEFGEVYLLDWGIAKVTGAAEVLPQTGDAEHGGTQAGSLLGTPGYMSPEQARGDVQSIDARTDVYALGAILFELLTLEPLNRGATVEALLTATMLGSDARASVRTPEREVPPELEAICVRATATDPTKRFVSARELHDALERFLDGQRDTERRRDLAQRHTLEAQVDLAMASRNGQDAEALRKKALRGLTTAVALDPTHEGAIHTLMQTLLAPVTALPPEAEAELKEIERQDRVRGARAASVAYTVWLVTLGPMLLLEVRDLTYPLALVAVLIALVGRTAWMARTGKATPEHFWPVLPLSGLAIGLLSCAFGPLVLVPCVALANTTAVMVTIRANTVTQRGLLALSLATVLVPFALQWAGLVSPFYALTDGVIQILPVAFEFPPVWTWFVLVSGTLLTIIAANILVGRAVDALKSAERTQFAQAWRLRQLLPEQARAGG